MAQPLLEIVDATKIYRRGFLWAKDQVVALQDLNLQIETTPATITTIAGESGSGKTTLANVVLGLVGLTSGRIGFKGHNIAELDRQQHLDYRRQVQAVFQDPYEVYNPFYRVRYVFDRDIRNFNLGGDWHDLEAMLESALRVVGLRAEGILDRYPHQLSGGERQRIMMARACLLKPALIVADEPVSMVDASLRSLILDTMLRLRDESGISFIYITHDLSTAYQVSDFMHVLYQGSVVEAGATAQVIEDPKHPYVQLLIDSIPTPDPRLRWSTQVSLPAEENGSNEIAKGCRFYPRCPQRMDQCLAQRPLLAEVAEAGHRVACHLY